MNASRRTAQSTRTVSTARIGGRALRRGVSMVESIIAALVALVTLGAALPGIDAVRERRHVEGLAAQLETDLQHARSLAVAQNRNLRVSFEQTAAGSCYVIHSGSANQCHCAPTGQRAVCEGNAHAFQSHLVPAGSAAALRSNVRSMLFEPSRGTVTPTGTVKVEGRSGKTIHVVINIMGRVRACSPAATPVAGYRAC
jgi:type IV fimbrial biogenesis protein FimT